MVRSRHPRVVCFMLKSCNQSISFFELNRNPVSFRTFLRYNSRSFKTDSWHDPKLNKVLLFFVFTQLHLSFLHSSIPFQQILG